MINNNYYYQTKNTSDNTIYNVHPSAFKAKELLVTTPEILVTAQKPKIPSSFDSTLIFEPVHGALDLMGKAFGKVTDTTGTTKVAQTVLPWLMPSQYIGWVRTRNYPGTNTGFGDSKEDQYLNEMFDLGTSSALLKGMSSVSKPFSKSIGDFTKKVTTATEGETPSILGPRQWLQEWTEESGKRQGFSSKEIKREFGKAKQDLISYINGDEFKQRVMNSGKFTEQEYPQLVSELENLIKNSRLVGKGTTSGGYNAPQGNWITKNFSRKFQHNGESYISVRDFKSPTQLRADLWHELTHSIGGHNKKVLESSPLVDRLRKYNESINPTKLSGAREYASTSESNLLKNLERDYPEWYKENPKRAEKFAKEETRYANWLDNEIVLKNNEVRSRMSATLDRFRQLGYDTKEILNNPQKFIDWINEIKHKKIHMPYDTQHLLMTYDIKDLANYASKMLSTTGVIYTGSQILNEQ